MNKVIRNRRVNSEAYGVFLRLVSDSKHDENRVSPNMKKLLEHTYKYDENQNYW